jgi:hypothetical protein
MEGISNVANMQLSSHMTPVKLRPRKPGFLSGNSGYSWSRDSQKIDCLRGGGKSIILHASTSALYTSIARSECSVPINFENHIYVKIFAKFDLFALKL